MAIDYKKPVMLTVKMIEARKDKIFDRYERELSALYRNQGEAIIRGFKAAYPKRTLKWRSGNGSGFWILDGEILDFDAYPYTDKRFKAILKVLIDFQDSIHDCPTLNCIDTGDIENV